ncbi:hypothetical protein ACOMHN_055875 [Nucella lapillus]
MVPSLALFLLAASALCVSTQDSEMFCPENVPNTPRMVTCASDGACADTEKCCSYNNARRCVDPVVPNFFVTLYFVNLTQTANEINHLTAFVKTKFSTAGRLAELEVERLGNCARARLSMYESGEGRAGSVVTSLTDAPVALSQFSGGPFLVTSALSDVFCSDAVPTFHAKIHVLNVTGFVRGSAVKNKIKSLVGSVGGGWEFYYSTIGSCLLVTMDAVLTSQQEDVVTSSLGEVETEGVTVGDSGATFNVTANNQQASVCYEYYVQNSCSLGHRMCGGLQKCVPEEAYCDGKDDCGNSADESHCNLEEYTVKFVTDLKWLPTLDDDIKRHKHLANIFRTSLTKAFISMSSFESATVLEIMKTKNHISAVASLTFRGPLEASGVRSREKDFMATGLGSGMVTLRLTSITPTSSGQCSQKDCGDGLCVEVRGGQAACRCLPGQQLETCIAIGHFLISFSLLPASYFCATLPLPVPCFLFLCPTSSSCALLPLPVPCFLFLCPASSSCALLPLPVPCFLFLCPTSSSCALRPLPVPCFLFLCPGSSSCALLPLPVPYSLFLCPASSSCALLPLPVPCFLFPCPASSSCALLPLPVPYFLFLCLTPSSCALLPLPVPYSLFLCPTSSSCALLPLPVPCFLFLCLTPSFCALLPLPVPYSLFLCPTSSSCALLPLPVPCFLFLCLASSSCALLPLPVPCFLFPCPASSSCALLSLPVPYFLFLCPTSSSCTILPFPAPYFSLRHTSSHALLPLPVLYFLFLCPTSSSCAISIHAPYFFPCPTSYSCALLLPVPYFLYLCPISSTYALPLVPVDCRGSDNYCGNSSTKCQKAAHLSGYACACPPGWTGEHCQIEVCSQLGSSVCGMNGQCVGDLANFTFCSCQGQTWGPFCGQRGTPPGQ